MKNRFRLFRMKRWGERMLVLSFVATLSFAPSQAKAASDRENANFDVYFYVSPPAKEVLNRFGMSEADIESYTRDGLRSRSVLPIGGDQLHKGSKDSLRVDIRRKKTELLLELSVRQGGSINYMLERWSNRRLVPVDRELSAKEFRKSLFGSVSVLLDELKSASEMPVYKNGSMMGDYVAEKDE